MTRMAADYQDLNARIAHLEAQVKWRNDVQLRLVEQNIALMAQQQRVHAQLAMMQQHLMFLQHQYSVQQNSIPAPPGFFGARNDA